MKAPKIDKIGSLLIVLGVLLFLTPFVFMMDLIPASMTATASATEVPYGSEVVIRYKWTTPDRTDVYHNRQWAVWMSGREGANNKYGSVSKIWKDPWAYRTPNEIVEGSFLVEVTRQTDTNVWKMRDGTWSTKTNYYDVYVKQLFSDGDKSTLYFDKAQVAIKLFVGEPVKADYNLVVYVLDENSKGLQGVTVSLDNGESVTTNSNGIASFSVNGQFNIIAVKSGYETIEKTTSITNSDVEVALTMNEVIPDPTEIPTPVPTEIPTPDPTGEPTETATPLWGTSLPTSIPSELPISNVANINFLFSDCEGNKIDGVELNVNDEDYVSRNGEVSFNVPIDTYLQVIALKEGYNRFSASYVAEEDLTIKVNLAESGGNYFIDAGDLKDDNPLTDAFGTAGAVPKELVISGIASLISGIFLVLRRL